MQCALSAVSVYHVRLAVAKFEGRVTTQDTYSLHKESAHNKFPAVL